MRRLLLFAVTLLLAYPYLAPRLIGTGDALWYHNSLADVVTQFRSGVFPVFVGQSAFSFNGSVYPIRAAPYFQYLAGLIDLLTVHKLGFFALEHLTALLSLLAGVFACYWALLWISPTRRWAAAMFALLYVMCPGVVGLFYAQDLYMSGMTIPWVPVVFAATVRSFGDNRLRPLAVLAGALAALWWAHSPIALWATAIACLGQIVRIFVGWRKQSDMARNILAAAIFTALAAYPILSVFLLRTPGEAIVPYIMDRKALLQVISDSFPSSIEPIHLGAPILSFLQLGYALWLVLLWCVWTWLSSRRHWAVGVLLGSTAFLILLLFPIPGIDHFLWFSFPETLVGMTLYWPMQRFYILIAAATVVSAYVILGEYPPQNAPRLRVIYCLLAGATIWSACEATKFIELAHRQSDTVAASLRWARPENIAIQRHAYGLFSRRPAYFTHGVVEPRLESRLLDPISGRVIASDYDAGRTRPPREEFLCRVDSSRGILDLGPPLHLQPGVYYLLTFDFARKETVGVLQMTGPNFFREYTLPQSGESKAFGSLPESENSIAVWTTAPKGETITLRFIPTGANAAPAAFIPFAKYRLEPIDEQSLPVGVSSLIPYRATVRSEETALLETPRMFVPGYAATVNGLSEVVRKSAEGLVAFRVPPGESHVELRFAGTLPLKIAFWLSASGWILFAVWLTGAQFGGFRGS